MGNNIVITKTQWDNFSEFFNSQKVMYASNGIGTHPCGGHAGGIRMYIHLNGIFSIVQAMKDGDGKWGEPETVFFTDDTQECLCEYIKLGGELI